MTAISHSSRKIDWKSFGQIINKSLSDEELVVCTSIFGLVDYPYYLVVSDNAVISVRHENDIVNKGLVIGKIELSPVRFSEEVFKKIRPNSVIFSISFDNIELYTSIIDSKMLQVFPYLEEITIKLARETLMTMDSLNVKKGSVLEEKLFEVVELFDSKRLKN